jgi:hypothetical protein
MTFQRTLTLLSLIALSLPAPAAAVRAQASQQSYLRDSPAQTDATDPRVRKVMARAEEHFRLGESALGAGNRVEARKEFDKAVDTVLESGVDLRSNPQLKRYYDGLVERIYRYESPSGAPDAGPRREADAGFAERKLEPSAVERPATPRVFVKNIPPNYAGNNAVSVFSAVAGVKASLSKGKFETTPEYWERLGKLLARLRVDGAKTARDELTFVVTPSEDYDADTRVYTVKVETLYSYVSESVFKTSPEGISLSDRRLRSVTLARTSKTLGSAVGRNAFGVKKRYVIRAYSTLKLSMPESKVGAWAGGLRLPGISPAKARQMVGRVRVAIRGRLAFPFTSSESTYDNATLNEPEESHYSDHSIYFEPQTLFVFDRLTGEALGASDLNDLPGGDDYSVRSSSTLVLERPGGAEKEEPRREEPAPPKAGKVRERKIGTQP